MNRLDRMLEEAFPSRKIVRVKPKKKMKGYGIFLTKKTIKELKL